jgi:hypothetical protein
MVKFIYYIIVYYESRFQNENPQERREIEVERFLEGESTVSDTGSDTGSELSSLEESEAEYNNSINFQIQNLSFF